MTIRADVDKKDPEVISRCFQFFQTQHKDWRDVLARFSAQETAGVVADVGDSESAWGDFLYDLQTLVWFAKLDIITFCTDPFRHTAISLRGDSKRRPSP